MGKVLAINVSKVKGIAKTSVEQVEIVEGWGLKGDAHGGDWDRQVSIFPVECLEKVPPEKKEEVLSGGYTENLTIAGVELSELAVGNFVSIGEAVIKILHLGKDEFKEHGRPYIVSREGRFGRVVQGGLVNMGDTVLTYKFNKEDFLKCCQEGINTMVQVFLNEKMDPNATDMYGATALMLAARNGHADVVRMLLDKGAGLNASSHDGITALMIAAYMGHALTVKMLLAAGSDPDMRSESGLTALSLAREGNHEAVIQILEKKRQENS
ncbi:FOG: Ankyrin repeat [Desulfotomaculum arcticum]|uniref:FOG: Ankyrin repeat n=1 Tax=Desulfotruncus arcticus DSM 17038 TaxID=1121424 RepID=A0A1I2W9Y4_9FIRM|nr:ankyrin repeat domain-containing protein [Desulfotruncus arcticus]SFG98203.1 FOG: Ankyrin repeat [Desulfotomaculum arcticum] [Desulfotruncus arcticus DSM 17038]